MSFEGVSFGGQANFTAAVVERKADFDNAVFWDKASFRESRFYVILFRKEAMTRPTRYEERQFNATVNIHGLTYQRIRVAWRELFDSMAPFDRQPYTHMETVFRMPGHDRQADDIYHVRRCCEARRTRDRALRRNDARELSKWQALREVPVAIFDFLQRVLFNYGVRPYRLIIFSLSIVAIGAYIFSFDNAVMLKEKDREVSQTASTSSQLNRTEIHSLQANPAQKDGAQSKTKALTAGQAIGFSLGIDILDSHE